VTAPPVAAPAAAASAGVKRRVHARLVAGDAGEGSLRSRVAELVAEESPLLGGAGRARLVAEVLAEVDGLGQLEPLLADPHVTEIMVNGPGRVWVERGGRLQRVAVDLDTGAIEHLIEKVVSPLGLRVDRSSPLVDARLPDGSRVNAVVPPLALDGPCLTVRRFGARAVPLDAFAPAGVAALLAWAVTARLNVLVSGGTGAGKTTLLNALSARIPPGERVITVEDAAELRLPGEHVVRLEARPANAEGAGEVRIRELVRNALRMRPDRIIVGEVRGPEALDMLQAMNTGHEGSLSTCHANSPDDALRRLETMVLMGDVELPLAAVRAQLTSALDLVVQVARRPHGSRRVVAVAQVLDAAGDGTGRTALLATEDGVVALPSCPPRVASATAPDAAWVEER
jgi:pilus assembly protein CpaF